LAETRLDHHDRVPCAASTSQVARSWGRADECHLDVFANGEGRVLMAAGDRRQDCRLGSVGLIVGPHLEQDNGIGMLGLKTRYCSHQGWACLLKGARVAPLLVAIASFLSG
jgi:hypothetical protein